MPRLPQHQQHQSQRLLNLLKTSKVLLRQLMLPLMVVVMEVLTAVDAAVINPRILSSKRAAIKVLSSRHHLLPLSLAALRLVTRRLTHPRKSQLVLLMFTHEY